MPVQSPCGVAPSTRGSRRSPSVHLLPAASRDVARRTHLCLHHPRPRHVGALVREGVALASLPALDERIHDEGLRRHPCRRRTRGAVPRGPRPHHGTAPPPDDRRHQRPPQRQARASLRGVPRGRLDVDRGPRQAQRDRRGAQALHRRDRGARRQRHALDRRHPHRAREAVREPQGRRRHDEPAHRRLRPQRPHTLGGLAREHPGPVLDARDERPRSGRLPAGPHDRVPQADPRRSDA